MAGPLETSTKVRGFGPSNEYTTHPVRTRVRFARLAASLRRARCLTFALAGGSRLNVGQQTAHQLNRVVRLLLSDDQRRRDADHLLRQRTQQMDAVAHTVCATIA